MAAIFASSPDKAGSASTPDGRIVFKTVTDVTPAYDPEAPGAKSDAERSQEDLRASMIDQYITALKKQLGVTINESVLRAAEGG